MHLRILEYLKLQLNLKYIEAEVTEFFPSTEDPKDIIYWEKFYFFKQTDIKDIETDKAGVYEIFLRKIQVFEKNQRKLSDEKLSFQEVAKLWYKEIFLPIKEILEITFKGIFTEKLLFNFLQKYNFYWAIWFNLNSGLWQLTN